MAKILVNIDTEAKSLEVLVNGEAQSDVKEVSAYIYPSYDKKDEDDLSVRVTMSNKDEESGITRMTYLMAKQNKIPGASPSKTYAGLYEIKKTDKVKSDISKYFGV